MAETDEVHVNGNGNGTGSGSGSGNDGEDNDNNNETRISDQFADIAYENPFVKFVRGFSNVPDESVRKMRFESVPLI